LWGAYTVSTFGDQVTLVALPLAVFARTQSALAVGIAASMQTGTALLFGFFAGVLADRWRHRAVLIGTDLVRGVVLGLVAVSIVMTPAYPVGLLYAAAFILGGLTVLHDAAAGASLPLVVRGRDLLKANGRLIGSEMAGNAGGPALAGVLFSFGGAGLAFLTDAASFLASALGVSRVNGLSKARKAPPREPRTVGSDMREGLRVLLADAGVLRALVLIAAMNVVVVAVEAQFIPYAKTVLHVGAAAIGAYFAVGGAAGVLTALALGRTETTRGDVMIAGVMIFSLGVLVAGLWPSWFTAGIAYVAAGVGSVLANTHWSSLRQRRFSVHVLGRVITATRAVVVGVFPFAYMAGGLIARSHGSAALFVAAACVGLLVSAWAFLVGLGGLRVEDVVDDPNFAV
jgi:hypothetical protein